MNQLCFFSSGLELAYLIVTSDLLQRSWKEISEIHKQNHIHINDLTSPSVSYKVYENRPNGTIIAFASSNQDTVSRDLVSSEELKGVFDFFDFVGTNVNRSFSVHKEAVTVFSSMLNELTLLKAQYGNSNPLIITGHALGGSIASLFTLWLLDSMSPYAKRPLCITFGSPLLGDKSFQQAISERPSWNSSFLHVVSNQDLFPQLFIAPCNGVADGFTSQTHLYKPFGTFLLCTESGCACFEEPESTLELLKAMGSKFVGNQNSQNSLRFTDYREILENLKHRSIYKGISQLDVSIMDPLLAGITMEITTIGVETQGDGGSLTTHTAERAKKSFIRKKNVFDPNKKLNDRKVDMAYLEWYKKVAEEEGGYYDSYKFGQSGSRDKIKSREEIVKRHRILTQYWKRMVAEAKKMPQKEGASFRIRWLYGGTNCRRMVEPLDIADYYKKGHRDYITRGRPEHYILLEQWLNEDMLGNAIERNRACSLTEDSCFWAHVEEAIILCDILKDGQSSPEDQRSSKEKLIRFEAFVMDMIKNYAVSREIFLPQSSFMKWWEMYSIFARQSVGSPLLDFMEEDYRNYA
ncbi:senescence-associated carboxylesterase 101-like isoform X1 [Olea europaea subsp. europaea]|uniref:Senescence-associated carboxylesterase 101-like isoform X1 n=1 Tax=Olea europaea subsp. europaea TaxID=158383 RepID=A0A8S0UDR8_OLEEU|nr:senescence-associated carboxylesterase 101-like isoform X1 [Olea europaea subsp. europaea]